MDKLIEYSYSNLHQFSDAFRDGVALVVGFVLPLAVLLFLGIFLVFGIISFFVKFKKFIMDYITLIKMNRKRHERYKEKE